MFLQAYFPDDYWDTGFFAKNGATLPTVVRTSDYTFPDKDDFTFTGKFENVFE